MGRGEGVSRRTRQRDAIRDAIERAGRPLAPREVLVAARRRVPRLGLATVYRALRGLEEEGWLRPVALPGEPARYERTGLDHHHHFHCRVCDRVYDLEGCPGSLRDLAPRRFRVESHEIILYGVCPECRPRG